MSDVALECRSLSCKRGGTLILKEVSLSLCWGNALVLRGPNGAGKTTLLRCLAGLQPPVSGVISVDFDDVVYSSHADGIKGTLSVRENLLFWSKLSKSSNVDYALQAFDLFALQDRLAYNLSAGQKRRLGLARLLVGHANIWVMDEPTVALDAKSVGLFAHVLSQHLQRGGAAIMATHIDLRIQAPSLDISRFAPNEAHVDDFDEAFL